MEKKGNKRNINSQKYKYAEKEEKIMNIVNIIISIKLLILDI